MKSKLLLLSFFMLLTVATSFAQITATSSGVAIQGIARDENGNARANQQVPLTLKLYYKLNGNETAISTQTVSNVTTDAFGVFSTKVDIDQSKYTTLAGNQTFLRISGKDSSGNLDIVISDQAFTQVPYAVVANNGVPTGSIMPYIGTLAPIGWALCDGAALPTDGSAAALIALVGNNTPNLQGMFLRGTGTSPVNGEAGPALKASQQDGFESHLHDKGTLVNSTDGEHVHDWIYGREGDDSGSGGSAEEFTFKNGPTLNVMKPAGIHSHTISGSTAGTGTNETRPVNYGVNYIIKL